ncbi:spermidine synthase [candidate division WOR-3 bacterium]|uniref:Polyamine aminopropyltransferase n=1 Tax=candidate division WOR-3 bacterium TaxID=2052148 RepID=A0A660SFA7_UNCW3|nr:MAG: spermidine synthase [candidate division WOR-3 bacterium]
MPKSQWYVEWFSDDQQWLYSVKEHIFQKRTPYQYIEILELTHLGRCLFLDQRLQSAECDEFIYHEALVHLALLTHPAPESVLIIGGGEGATLREVLRHPVKRAVMVDIDKEVVDASIRYLPTWSNGAFDDPRTELHFEDARKWVERTNERFDCIISDLTEPIEDSPARYLFTLEFYQRVNEILTPDGILVCQAGTTVHFYAQFFVSLIQTLRRIFPVVAPYQVVVPTFHWPWGFIIGSKNYDPRSIDRDLLNERIAQRELKLRYYNRDLHYALFTLPTYFNELIKRGRVLTDKEPFVWEG